MRNRLEAFALRHPDIFYWRIILPLQTLLLLAYCAPLYGFSALLGPINSVFSPEQTRGAMAGVLTGSLLFLGVGFGALFSDSLLRLAKSPARLLIALNIAVLVVFSVGGLACELDNLWLFLLGFALPTGLIFSNIFSLAMRQLMGWANHFNRAGLQAGFSGLVFGLWGALFSFYGASLEEYFGLPLFLCLCGVAILLTGLAATFFYFAPPQAATSGQLESKSAEIIALDVAQILKLAPYWLFLVFFLLFLMPGFGFKIVVQEFSQHVFQTSGHASAMIAIAFLLSYGLSRLIFGLLSDSFNSRPLYLGFVLVQAICLLIAALTLPSNQNVVFFTVLMCLIGGSFAAGKSCWVLLQLKLYGPESYNNAVRATMPAFGLAGLLGPLTLNWTLDKADMLTATSTWFYSMSAALGICFFIVLMLKKVDYARVAVGQPQPISITLRSKDPSTRF